MVILKGSFWLSELSSLYIGRKATLFWEVSASQNGKVKKLRAGLTVTLATSPVCSCTVLCAENW